MSIEEGKQKSTDQFILRMNEAVKNEDHDEMLDIIYDICELPEDDIAVDALNHLLIIKGHFRHENILKSIQDYAHPSSVKYIEVALNQGFEHIDYYNGSGFAPISQWFSYALASINTKEAVDLLKKYARHENDEISGHMRRLLEQIT